MTTRWDKEYSEMFNAKLDHVGVMETTILHSVVMTSTHLRCERPPQARSNQYAQEEAFFVACQLQELEVSSHWCNGRIIPTTPYRESNVAIYDMRESWSALIDKPFDVLVWHVTRSGLDAMADAHGSPRVDRLICSPAHGQEDATVRRFANLLLPFIDDNVPASDLCTGHLLLGLQEYLAVRYGGLVVRPKLMRGGLAPWQIGRVTDYMRANLSSDMTLDMLAAECRLSVNHFVRAFRASTGSTPHRWLMNERLRAADELLKRTDLSIAMIAVQCGFADQSHLTRNFTRHYRVSPSACRRDSKVQAR